MKFAHVDGYVPFGAMATDPMEHGRQLFEELVAGKWGAITPFNEAEDAQAGA
ncbi:hypothetical protein [Caballeronia sp. INDeC2]|uniref:hypothetical protein n=1 Tax=Caballeronia sp. INDeC2 TaxID=2921747 RepID=UPI0020283010|nr:hypothetical protein [Caballeronia sp. INDeC2]